MVYESNMKITCYFKRYNTQIPMKTPRILLLSSVQFLYLSVSMPFSVSVSLTPSLFSLSLCVKITVLCFCLLSYLFLVSATSQVLVSNSLVSFPSSNCLGWFVFMFGLGYLIKRLTMRLPKNLLILQLIDKLEKLFFNTVG